MKKYDLKQVTSSQIINGMALFFSLSFLIAAGLAAWYAGEAGEVLHGFYLILVTPSPLVTDYVAIGGLSSSLLNAGACGAGLLCLYDMFKRRLPCEYPGGILSGRRPLLLRSEFFKYVALFSGPPSST